MKCQQCKNRFIISIHKSVGFLSKSELRYLFVHCGRGNIVMDIISKRINRTRKLALPSKIFILVHCVYIYLILCYIMYLHKHNYEVYVCLTSGVCRSIISSK